MKYEENQVDLLTPSIPKNSSIQTQNSYSSQSSDISEILQSPYQDVLDKIVVSIMEQKQQIWASEERLKPRDLEKKLIDMTNRFVQSREYDICIASNWNLNRGSGSEILSYILKMSNNFYDFKTILDQVNKLALETLFLMEKRSTFRLNPRRQSSLYLACLRQVCEQMQYQAFLSELMEFMQSEKINE